MAAKHLQVDQNVYVALIFVKIYFSKHFHEAAVDFVPFYNPQ